MFIRGSHSQPAINLYHLPGDVSGVVGKQERDSGFIDIARKRVADNPTDLQLRYELGEAL